MMPPSPRPDALTGAKKVVAIASGKGGVGKSTVTANLACALQQQGATVGVLDADIYGPTIPAMFGLTRPPLTANDENKIVPWNHNGIKIMSMGFIVDETSPVIWRGPMVHSVLTQFLTQVEWGELDYVLIDLPPGTGDAQLTLTQTAPLSGAVIVSTPQDVALNIAAKGLRMFREVNVPVIGLIENMSYFSCPHCGGRSDILSHGGAARAAEKFGIKLLGEIPLDAQIVRDGDEGVPTVTAHPDSTVANVYREIADNMIAQLNALAHKVAPAASPSPLPRWGKGSR